jgi:alkylated DNA repair protein alkB homolog 6
MEIENFKLGKIPNIYYVEDFITKEEEEELISNIYNSKTEWISLSNRKLQNSGGTPHHEGMIEEEFPKHFQDVGNLLEQCGFTKKIGKMNQVLLNEYSDGKGISFHKDGPLYFEFAAILSLKSKAILEFKKDRNQKTPDASVLLNERSLLIFTEEAYTEYFHGIKSNMEETIDETCLNPMGVWK